MQDKTLLRVCTKKRLLTQAFYCPLWIQKISLKKVKTRRFSRSVPKTSKETDLFILLTLAIFFSTQMQDNTLLAVCTEKRLIKLNFFRYSRWKQNFS